ncbi:MAG: TRAP transporter large permease [Thermodesulfobacteriota bacterium]
MLILLIAGIFILAALGLPIGFSLMIPSAIVMKAVGMDLLTLPTTLFAGTTSFVILAVPLFIFMGELMSATSIAERLVNFARTIVGWMRGGLAHVNIVSNMFMAEISGSSVADAAALGKIFIPQMTRIGYPKPYAATVTSTAAIIGIIIPPSIPLVVYGAVTNTSIRDLFLSGIVPGVLLGLIFMMTSYIFARRKNHPVDQKFQASRVVPTLKQAVIPLMIPVIIIGGLIGGLFTATEAAAIGVVIALIFGLMVRELNLRTLYRLLIRSTYQTAAVMIILAGAAALGQVLANEQIPQRVAMFIGSIAHTTDTFLLLVNGLLLIVGMFLQPSAAIIIIVPILVPIAVSMGIDPVHFGIVVCVNLAIGQQTPPVANVLLTVCGISGVKMQETFPYLVWYIMAMLIVLMLTTYVPFLAMWFR